MRVHTYVYVCMYIHTYIHTYIHRYIDVYVYIYIYLLNMSQNCWEMWFKPTARAFFQELQKSRRSAASALSSPALDPAGRLWGQATRGKRVKGPFEAAVGRPSACEQTTGRMELEVSGYETGPRGIPQKDGCSQRLAF